MQTKLTKSINAQICTAAALRGLDHCARYNWYGLGRAEAIRRSASFHGYRADAVERLMWEYLRVWVEV